MRKIITSGFIFVLCLLITACSTNNDNTPVKSEPLADISQVASNPPSQTAPLNTLTEDTENAQPLDYSNFVGVWRGYAIAISYTLVITDVIENEMTFLFVYLNRLCPKGDAPDMASPVYTMPIIDNQIIFVNEGVRDSGEQFTHTRTLTFYDDHISLVNNNTNYDGHEFEIEWQLMRLS
ncbi:MAG: hypothetical protein FWD91_06870 [Treponema sp.]|nr:hypothetical protein [Treponema sp.]